MLSTLYKALLVREINDRGHVTETGHKQDLDETFHMKTFIKTTIVFLRKSDNSDCQDKRTVRQR